MKRLTSTWICLLILATAIHVVSAKGVTTKIIITGAGLQSPIEIRDPDVLKNFNVWSGPGTFTNGVEGTEGFIVDWASGAVTNQPSALRTFAVSFYVKYFNRPLSEQTDRLVYVVTYAIDPATGKDYVYLPGNSDESYKLNSSTILRGREGQWFRANVAWQKAFASVAPR
jgi:hypothetical protein